MIGAMNGGDGKKSYAACHICTYLPLPIILA
jgi:hypothetical protein